MGAADIIRKAVAEDPTGDPQVIAASIRRRLSGRDVVGLIVHVIVAEQRNLARRQEQVAFSSIHRASRMFDPADPGTPVEEMTLGNTAAKLMELLESSPFKMGDGSDPLQWGTATVAQHEARIAMLSKIRDGIDATIARHREAISLCRQAGVDRLMDVPKVA